MAREFDPMVRCDRSDHNHISLEEARECARVAAGGKAPFVLAIEPALNVERFVVVGDWVAEGQIVARVYAADGSSRDATSPAAGIVVRDAEGRFVVHGPSKEG